MAGYSGTPLVRKLGIKPGFRLQVINPPDHYFDLISPLPGEVVVETRTARGLDFIHLFVSDKKALLSKLPSTRTRIKPAGMVWVSWPKKTSGSVTDIDGNSVREEGLKNGFVDVKVCAVDETWSALKFVIPVKDRGNVRR